MSPQCIDKSKTNKAAELMSSEQWTLTKQLVALCKDYVKVFSTFALVSNERSSEDRCSAVTVR